MKRRDLLEWLSLSPADIPRWLALVAVGAMFFVWHSLIDMIFAIAALALAFVACLIGMKPDPELSRANNLARQWLSPVFLVLVLVAAVVHYALWQPAMEARRSDDDVNQSSDVQKTPVIDAEFLRGLEKLNRRPF